MNYFEVVKSLPCLLPKKKKKNLRKRMPKFSADLPNEILLNLQALMFGTTGMLFC